MGFFSKLFKKGTPVTDEFYEEMEEQGRLPFVAGFSHYRDIPYYLDHPDEATPEIAELMRVYTEILDAEYRPNKKFPGCFPPGMPLGATWDEKTVYECAEALGREMEAYKIDVILGSPNCNIHRVVHYLSQMATEAYEHARQTVASFINAPEAHEIVFTRGTTESLNLLATSLGLLFFDGYRAGIPSGCDDHGISASPSGDASFVGRNDSIKIL